MNCFTKTNKEIIEWFKEIDWSYYWQEACDIWEWIGSGVYATALIIGGVFLMTTVIVKYEIGPLLGILMMFVGGVIGWCVWKYLSMLIDNCSNR